VAVKFVAKALVVVEFPTIRFAIVPNVAARLEKNPVVEVLFVAVKFVAKALVVVEFPTIRFAIAARVAIRDEINPFVDVEFVVTRLAIEPFCTARLVTVPVEAVKEPVVIIFEVRLVIFP
jgi:hypothetical protein